jgi:ribosomal protein S18 acetylase RimI-like enzyme
MSAGLSRTAIAPLLPPAFCSWIGRRTTSIQREQQRGYVLNVFVEPEYRRRGLAQALMSECMDEARRRGIRVVALHASKKGQPVYEKLGFTTSNEMLFVDAKPEQP